jgi:hypothetical protein
MAKLTHTTIDPETGHTLAHYESGVIRDQDSARLIAGPKDPALNPVLGNPLGMLQRRRELAEAAAWDAANKRALEMIEAGEVESISIDKLGSAPVIAAAASKATTLFLQAKTGREAEGIGAFLLKLLGLGGTQRIEIENHNRFSVDEQTRRAIVDITQALSKAMEPPALEGEVIDNDPTP